MLKLTRIAAVALIGLAVLLAVIALMIGRKPDAPAMAAPVAQSEAQAITVVEAVARLPAGEPITANGLRLAQRSAPVAGAATSLSSVVGKVPVQDIAEGTTISSSVLAQGFSLQLRPGERALAVPVDELVGAGNRILPGDFVDVFLNLRNAQPNVSGPAEAAQTRLLLSRLRVLSYGQQDIAPAASEVVASNEGDTRNDSRAADITGSSSQHSGSDTAQPARSAVLAVPVADANRLLLGAQQGKLFLALRNPADTGQPDLALFPQARGVIDPLRGLDAEQQLALQRPENHAFAGIDGDALAGRGNIPARGNPAPTVRAPASRRSAPRASGIEIIRGDSSAPRGSL
ncbi:TPA: Flp pilus assembly protein CpaB [Stenotrophomonas maltophilia]|uniref:Flp pilus assembly protein CpaB n=1 Tax=Stenotrophomonas maltophilia TaxID=40324 RepID=UPI0015DE5E0D|nr:Flp pilus assembly protein CpaB [Stenotrophomonas maltophilia]MBA0448246.1 Flp pilus assembly protein CpaB [Stenotrophomonas maltophilia]HEL2979294.1 Flp pilus assembly protein CpaB [Stenotrophomonas maltophilia]